MNEYRNVLIKAVDSWGIDAQLMMAQEECAELIQAISKFFRKKPQATEMVIEELADVKIMIAQLELLFDTDEIKKMIEIKIDRLAKRLDDD
jgi:NTP pyrophosphatase (non-canonical NTP hydrolase)